MLNSPPNQLCSIINISVAPSIQGNWRGNDYVNAFRLVDGFSLSMTEQKTKYIWYMINQYKYWLSQTYVTPAVPSRSVITFSRHTPDIVYPANYVPTLATL